MAPWLGTFLVTLLLSGHLGAKSSKPEIPRKANEGQAMMATDPTTTQRNREPLGGLNTETQPCTITREAPPATPSVSAVEAKMTSTIVLRLKPGQDLKLELQQLCESRHLKAACVLTCVGSLNTMKLRLANQPTGSDFAGPLQIVSLVGTLSQNGSHLHLSASDAQGKTTGGHLMDGCLIYTTAEIVIGVFDDTEFRRELDPQTGSKELQIVGE